MKIPVVDYDACEGCGTCEAMCPEVFQMKDDKAYVINAQACKDCNCQDAADACPVSAITMQEE
ncbi:MAG: ferredoxin [Nitrospirota bacterium]